MHLHGGFGRAEMCPRKHLERKVDGRGIESVDGVVQVDPESIAGLKSRRYDDQGIGKIAINAPVAFLVRIAQITPRDVPTNAEMIDSGFVCAQTDFDIA